jgi:hypothetical protein
MICGRISGVPVLVAMVLALVGATPGEGPEAGAWCYVLPEPGDPHEHPPPRAISLSDRKPVDVLERVAYRGTRRRYAQLRFGGASSVRVTIVLDEVGPGEADLYVDADRNRRIEPRDRVAGIGRTWRLPLDAEIVEGEVTGRERRAGIFRLGSSGRTLGFAAAGYLEGTVRLGDRTHRARRVDGDGNGLLADPRDRLWIDLDDDGRWDPADEQFAFGHILTLGGTRFAVRADELGRRLVLEPLTATGTVRLAVARPEGAARVATLEVTLIGSDGSAFGLANAGAEATVPVGAFRLGALTLSLEDPSGGPRWSYVFSVAEGGEPRWHEVGEGGMVALDPLGAVALAAEVEGPDPRRPGDELTVRPRLFTADGLSLVTCYRGTPASPLGYDGPGAEVALAAGDGRPMATARSGFA